MLYLNRYEWQGKIEEDSEVLLVRFLFYFPQIYPDIYNVIEVDY